MLQLARLTLPLGLAAAVAGVALPGSAAAATVQVLGVQESPSAPARGVVRYRAAAGEANDLAVASVDGEPGVVELREAAVAIAPGPGCAAVDPRTVRCDGRLATSPFGRQATYLGAVRADLGDRADSARSAIGARPPGPALAIELRGDGGNDRLTGGDTRGERLSGGAGSDALEGGGGGDALDGGPGPDRVRGGEGDDLLDDGDDRRRDVLDGGTGRDELSYARRRGGVRVDLARGRGADADRLRSIENVSGGRGADALRGDRRPNKLRGGGGRDLLEGRAGGDTLTGDDGADRMLGGAGRDLLEAIEPQDDPDAPGPADRAGCGSGRDTVRHPRIADRVGTDCERAIPAEPEGIVEVAVSLPLRASRRGIVSIPLSDTGESDPFAGRVALRFRGLLLGRPSPTVRLREGGRATARVRLVSAALARLRESRRLTVTVALGTSGFTTILRPGAREPGRPRTGLGGGTPA